LPKETPTTEEGKYIYEDKENWNLRSTSLGKASLLLRLEKFERRIAYDEKKKIDKNTSRGRYDNVRLLGKKGSDQQAGRGGGEN